MKNISFKSGHPLVGPGKEAFEMAQRAFYGCLRRRPRAVGEIEKKQKSDIQEIPGKILKTS